MKKGTFLLLALNYLVSCSDDSQQTEENDMADENAINISASPELQNKSKVIFQTIPSSFETADIFEKAGASYNKEATNSRDNVYLYTTSTQQALNLGVYGADLSYANIFNQSQESMFYLNCSKILADALGITSAFTAKTISQIEKNANNRDSLMVLVNDAFWMCDAYLKENHHEDLSVLIIAGGWIEGLYLGSSSLDKNNPNKELMQKIAEQKYSLNNLIDLLGSYQNEQITALKTKLNQLKTAFDQIEEKTEKTTVSSEPVPVIGGGSSLVFKPETIFEISIIVNEIRNEIIK